MHTHTLLHKLSFIISSYAYPNAVSKHTSDRELRFGYQLNGSLVLATNEDELKILDELMERGRKNGVERLRIVQREELFEIEPALNPDAIAARFSSSWNLSRSRSGWRGRARRCCHLL